MPKSIVAPHLAELGIDSPAVFLADMLKTMSYEDLASHLGLKKKSLHSFCLKLGIKPARARNGTLKWIQRQSEKYLADKSAENKVVFFKCVRCGQQKNTILMSTKPDLCQRCKKHIAMERV